MIYNYLTNRFFSAMDRNSYSSFCLIEAGVPQGSFLGPTLLNIYTNGIISVEDISNIAISVYGDNTNISVLSGSIDIAVWMLNGAVDQLEPWFRKWRIRIHANKCTLTLFPNDCVSIAAVRVQ
jgi:hypothetical protein